jgi:hypothetical protein
MQADNLATEARTISNFDRVVLEDYGEMTMTQGEQESLIVEARPDFLPKLRSEVRDGTLVLGIGGGWWNKIDLSTSLNRRVIRYRLVVRKLMGLTVAGVASVVASGIVTDQLALHLGGAGQTCFESLTARLLDVRMPGAGLVTMTGHAAEQRLSFSGLGSYDASGLMCNKASVHLTGAGRATVWVVKELDARIDGIGTVQYYGAPAVTQRVSGLGRLTSLGNRS